jgi:hypothetical protein
MALASGVCLSSVELREGTAASAKWLMSAVSLVSSVGMIGIGKGAEVTEDGERRGQGDRKDRRSTREGT